MDARHLSTQIRKTLYWVMLAGMLLVTLGTDSMQSARAQEDDVHIGSLFVWSPVADIVLYSSLNSKNGGPGLQPYDLKLYNAQTDQEYNLVKSGYVFGSARFSEDGSTISFWYEKTPYIVSINGNSISTSRIETDEVPIKGAFSSNNDLLVYTTTANEIRVKNLTTNFESSLGEVEKISTLPFLFPKWSPDDLWVAFGTESNGILIDPSRKNESVLLQDLALPQSEFSSTFQYFVWSDSGNTLYDYKGNLVHAFTSNIEPMPILEPQRLSVSGKFEILESSGELYVRNKQSVITKQLTFNKSITDQIVKLESPLLQVITPNATANGFDYPVGKPDGVGYNTTAGCWWLQRDGACAPGPHPGQDFNGNGGGDSDLGDPVYAVANGTVVFSGVGSGTAWGNIILIEHALPDGSKVWSQYAHLKDRYVSSGTVNKGYQIGTIGKGYNNLYYAHLHFEIRIQYRAADAWVSGWTDDQVRQYYAKPDDYINSRDCSKIGKFLSLSPKVGRSHSKSMFF